MRADDGNLVCNIAQDRHQTSTVWLNLWTVLLWFFGLVVVVFLVAAILMFIRQDWLPAALLTFGTIVESVGIKWVTERRSDALREEAQYYKQVESACRGVQVAERRR
jgi:hypothetical protein